MKTYFVQTLSNTTSRCNPPKLDDLLPTEVYADSDQGQGEHDVDADEGCAELLSDLMPESPRFKIKSNNAAVIAGPPTIAWKERNLLMRYPLPCKVLREFADTQLLVQLAWPYDDVCRRYPSIVIEREYDSVCKIEQDYAESVKCKDLGYRSLQQIDSSES